MVNDQRPKLKLQVNAVEIEDLVDSRTDITIILQTLVILNGHFKRFIEFIKLLLNGFK